MKAERWQRIEQLLHSALKLEASRRAAFLKEACDGDEALRSHVARSSRILAGPRQFGPPGRKAADRRKAAVCATPATKV